MHSIMFSRGICNFCAFAIFCFCIILTQSADVNKTTDDDLDVDPYNVREEGCPVVSERDKLNISKISGSWVMPFSSLNWLADIGMSLYNRSVKMSQITTICPRILLTQEPSKHNRNANWTVRFICPKLKGEFELWCWYQNAKSKSKLICWNDHEARDMYLMIAATNLRNWIVLIRCSPKEEGRPAEGMSWAVLAKEPAIKHDISDVLFGLLEGYGFDVKEFKVQLLYDSCPDTHHNNNPERNSNQNIIMSMYKNMTSRIKTF